MKDLAQITQEFNNKEVLYEPITYNNVHNIWTFGLNSSTDGTFTTSHRNTRTLPEKEQHYGSRSTEADSAAEKEVEGKMDKKT